MNTLTSHAHLPLSSLKGDARERILRVALTEFAQRGFDGVSTTEIAKAASVTQPLIHYHFKNKEALWRATADELFVAFYRDMKDLLALNFEIEPEVKTAIIIRNYVQFTARYPEWTRFVVSEGSNRSGRLLWMADTWIRPLMLKVSSLCEKGAEEGWLRPIPLHEIVSMVLSSGSLYAIAPMINMLYGIDSLEHNEVERYVKTSTRMLCSALLVNPPPESAYI